MKWLLFHGIHYCNALNPDEKIKQMAEKYGVTKSQLILKWLFNHAENILLIPGT